MEQQYDQNFVGLYGNAGIFLFEEMKNSGSLRYIQNKEVLNAILRYEENASQAETRSMVELEQYNAEFRPTITY